MNNIFVEFLPPWVETGLQPAFYDKESGTVLQQTARMYARVNMLIRMFNKLSKQTKEEIERFEVEVNSTVEEFINKFNELHDYVHGYFDNLDVQEEINNKLDEMVESGELQEIISHYLQPKVSWHFDTVAEMITDGHLVEGGYARTLGYYQINDKGGSNYKIVATQPTGHYETLSNGLYAELIIEDDMNVMQFGVQNDTGNTNYTSTLQTALKSGTKNLTFNSGTYTITEGLNVGCNVYGSPTGKTTISFPTADPTKYSLLDSIFVIYNQTNITVAGFTMIGSFSDSNPGPIDGTSEHAHGFALKNAHDITIRDCNASKLFGDFAYVGGGREGEANEGKSTNVTIDNCVVNEIKRMLVSFIHCDTVFVSNCNVKKEHINVAIFDLEPNDPRQQTTNIVIRNNFIDTTGNCFAVAHFNNNLRPISLNISNNYIKRCSNLFTATNPTTAEAGEPYLDDLVLENNYVEEITTAIFGTDTRIRGISRGVIKGNTVPQEILIAYSRNLTIEGNKCLGFNIQNSNDINVNGNNTKYVKISTSNDIVITNNTIKRESYAYDTNCVYIASGNKIFINNNYISLSRYPVRIQLTGDADSIFIKNNVIVTSQYGLYTYQSTTYTHTNMDLSDNIVIYDQQGDTDARTFVKMLDNLNKQYDTSNYFKLNGIDTYTGFNQGIKGQYVKNSNPTLQSDSVGSYYVKGWLCVDAENQTWIPDKLRV